MFCRIVEPSQSSAIKNKKYLKYNDNVQLLKIMKGFKVHKQHPTSEVSGSITLT